MRLPAIVKLNLIVLSMFTLSLVTGQTPTLYWSDTIHVADGALFGNILPRLAVTANGEPIAVWGELGIPSNMYVSDWTGTGFGKPRSILPSGMEARIASNSTADIVAYGNDVYITYSNVPEIGGHIYMQKSVDGGMVFGDTIRIDTYEDSMRTYSSSIEVTSSGNPAIVFFKKHEMDSATFEVVATQSSDGGSNFSTGQSCTANASGISTDCCKPMITIKDNYYAVLYRNDLLGKKEIYASISNNGGASFDTVIRFDRSDFVAAVCPVSNPSGIILGDSLYGIWMTNASGIPKIELGTINVVNNSFGYNVRVDTSIADSIFQNTPEIAGNGDTLGIVWVDNRNTSSAGDCFFRFTVNGIANFSPVYNINEIIPDGDHATPDVIFHNGVFHFLYSDNLNNKLIYRTASFKEPLSVSDLSRQEANVYPNPFSGFLNLEYTGRAGNPATVTIFDVMGNAVFKNTISGGRGKIQTENLPSGVYFVSIMVSGNEVMFKKLVKL